MSIAKFSKIHKGSGVAISSIAKKWKAEKAASDFLGTPVFGALVLGDLISGRELFDIDKIPPDILESMKQIFPNKVDSIATAKKFLVEKIANGDASVMGTANALQGRLGEFSFQQQFKGLAELSQSPTQQHYDVKVMLPNEPTNYVQVKVYKDSNAAFDEFQKLNNAFVNGEIVDQGIPVKKFSFAVNDDLFESIQSKASELGSDIEVLSIGASYDQIRQPALDAITDHGTYLDDFFEGLLGGMVVGAALHAGVNGFLCYRGHKALNTAIEDTAYSTLVTGGGAAAGMGVESLLLGATLGPLGVLLVFGTGISTRSLLKRITDRRHIAKSISKGNADLFLLLNRIKKAV